MTIERLKRMQLEASRHRHSGNRRLADRYEEIINDHVKACSLGLSFLYRASWPAGGFPVYRGIDRDYA